MSDGVVELQHAMQNLGRAANAYQGSSFLKYFAAKLISGIDEEGMKTRQAILRIGGQLVDTELEEAMDELVSAWLLYRKKTGG